MHESAARAPVTLVLLAANILVFAAMLFFGAGFWHGANTVQLAWGANFGPATQDGQWWRLATALFLHFGVIHLALNMWALWDVGRLVEKLLGRWRFVGLYLGSGVIGNLLSLVLQGNSAVSGGASGAIFGLYGALLVFLWRERRQVERGEFRWMFGAAIAFTTLAMTLGAVVPGIDNAAHAGGLIAGALTGAALLRPWTSESPRAVPSRWLAAAALATVTVGLATHIPAPSYRLGDEMRARAAIRQFLVDDRRISQRWESILDQGLHDRLSLDQLAGHIDTHVAADYQESFDQLSALRLGAAAPSAQTLDMLRKYAARRSDASHAMADGLRTRDPEKFRRSLVTARQAPAWARGLPAQAASDAQPVEAAPARPELPR